MATSYKKAWQEAQEQIEKLRAENKQLREGPEITRMRDGLEMLSGEISQMRAQIAESPNAHLRELNRTRQIVDLAGIARHMHVERFTPQQWRQREYLPEVDFPEIKEPLWYASTIRDGFARPTGRLWCEAPSALHAVACDIPHSRLMG